MTLACAGILEPERLGLKLLKSMFDAVNFICRFSWSIFSHFVATHSWNVHCNQKCKKKFAQNPSFEGLRSFMVIDVDLLKSPCSVLAMISNLSVPVCNRFHTRRANSGKITFLGVTPVWRSRSRGTPSLLSRKTRVHSEDFMILACTVLMGLKVVTDGRTDAGHG